MLLWQQYTFQRRESCEGRPCREEERVRHKCFSRRLLRNIQLIHFLKFKSSMSINMKRLQEMLILGHPACGITSLALWSSLPLPNGRSPGFHTVEIHCSVGLRSRILETQEGSMEMSVQVCCRRMAFSQVLHHSPDGKLVVDAM